MSTVYGYADAVGAIYRLAVGNMAKIYKDCAVLNGKKIMKASSMKKSTKIWLIVLAVVLVLAVVAITVMFTVFNTFRFMAMPKSAIQRAQDAYVSRMDSENPVKFIAHRGLSEEAYQNTAAAFELAGQEETVWGIETDVWMTNDGGAVCMHDANALNGIDNVRNVSLERATTTPLRHNTSEYAPSIQTYLNICKTYGKVAVIELKDSHISATDVSIILSAVRESGATATIISFHYDLLKEVRRQDANIPMQALTLNATFMSQKQINEIISMRCDLSSYYQFVSKSVVRKFHEANLKVGIWTVNSAKDAVCCVGEFDVDYITTDRRLQKEIAQNPVI